jgi:hypothetical protein
LKRFQQRFQQGAEPLGETVPYGLPYRMMLDLIPVFVELANNKWNRWVSLSIFALPRVIG